MKKTKVFTLILLWILSCSIFFQFSIPVKALPVYEDFTTYTEVDPTSFHISLNSTNINHTAWLNEDAYVYNDKGVDAFGDFEHDVEAMYINDFGGSGYRKSSFWGLANELNDVKYFIDNGVDCIFASYTRRTNGTRMFQLQAQNGSTTYDDYYQSPDLDVWYYFSFQRDEAWVSMKVYNDSAKQNLVTTLNITSPTTEFRYIYACNTWSRDYNVYQVVHIRNLYLKTTWELNFYFNEGGQFRVENATISNGTSIIYVNGTVIELASLPQNSSYVFSHFQWDSTNSTTNFYNLTVSSNFTVWCYFDFPPAVQRGEYIAVLLAISFIFIPLLIFVVWAAGRRK